MKHTLIFASVFSSVLLFNSAFAQQELALNKAVENTIPARTPPITTESDGDLFQAVVFPRLNGNVSVHVKKARLETIWVSVYDADGQMIIKNKLGNRSLITKEYDFQKLAKGTYTFKIASSGKVYKKEVAVK